MKGRAVFLDRDGVINRYAYNAEFGSVDSPARADQFWLLTGVGEAIAELNRMNLPAIVVSNQPGIAKGKFSPALLDAINEEMRSQLARYGARLDAIYYCRHHPEAVVSEYRVDCDCRKPKPGLFFRAAAERNLDLGACFFIGDGVVDVLAGRAAGVSTLLVAPSRCTVCCEFAARGAVPDFLVRDLAHAVEVIRGKIAAPSNGYLHKDAAIPDAPALAPCALAPRDSAYSSQYLAEAAAIISRIDPKQIERVADLLRELREREGRLFLLGVGGGAGHASHAACDFRKIAGIESYCVSDNVSELTARVNDEGWDTSYREWLRASRLDRADLLFVFSVGGGSIEKNISANLVRALEFARERGASIAGVVGRDGGATAHLADACVLIPVVNSETITPQTESFQALIWHLLVSHPALKLAQTKWESVAAPDRTAPVTGATAPSMPSGKATSRAPAGVL